jgi:uncharacterized protein
MGMDQHHGSESPDPQGGQLLHNLLLFGRVCKRLGIDVTPSGMIDVAHALEYIDLGVKPDFYHALRALIVTRQRDLALFDEAFRRFWQRPRDERYALDVHGPNRQSQRKTRLARQAGDGSDGAAGGDGAHESDRQVIVPVFTYSHQDILRRKDFAEMTGEELVQARQMMARLRWSLGTRRTRRFMPGRGEQLDLRQSFRRNLRYGGETLDLPTRSHKVKPRALVLLCDISGSMERYTRVLLHFMHTLANSIYQVESFVFSTRLTCITRTIRHKSVDVALRQVSARVQDWGGGTRIGEVLREFNFCWSRRVLGRGTVVLLISDGWDRGEPGQLRHEIARVQHNCYRLIWLNPLIGASQYEPLTRGAQAMLPFVDDFLPVRNLSNLESLARELHRVDWQRPERPAHAHLIRD